MKMVEATTLIRHKTNDIDFLSFDEGEILKIVEMGVTIEDFSWYRAYSNGKQGLVCGSMLDIQPYHWFWAGTMNRLDAETRLLDQGLQFLIRRTPDENFYLSYKSKIHRYKVWHFLLDFNKENVTFSFFNDWKGARKIFFSLTELAHFVKVSGTHMCIRWELAADEEEEIERQKRRLAPWKPNN